MAHRQQGAPGPTHENLGVPEALEEGPVSEGLGWWPETLQRNMEIFLVAFEVKVPYLKKKKSREKKKKSFFFYTVLNTYIYILSVVESFTSCMRNKDPLHC